MWVPLRLFHISWACRISSKGLCMDMGGGETRVGNEVRGVGSPLKATLLGKAPGNPAPRPYELCSP